MERRDSRDRAGTVGRGTYYWCCLLRRSSAAVRSSWAGGPRHGWIWTDQRSQRMGCPTPAGWIYHKELCMWKT